MFISLLAMLCRVVSMPCCIDSPHPFLLEFHLAARMSQICPQHTGVKHWLNLSDLFMNLDEYNSFSHLMPTLGLCFHSLLSIWRRELKSEVDCRRNLDVEEPRPIPQRERSAP